VAAAGELDATRLHPPAHHVGHAVAVDLEVVDEEDALRALLLQQRGERGRLLVVGGRDAPVGAGARGVVLVRLAGLRGLPPGQADVGVAGRDLEQPGLIEDRDRDRRGAGVELPEVGDRRRVLGGAAGVRRDALGRPGPAVGVVERDEADGERPRPASRLLQRELLATDGVLGFGLQRPAQRQARLDRQVLRRGGRRQREERGGDQQRGGAAHAQNV
jgi:hypothetical protein